MSNGRTEYNTRGSELFVSGEEQQQSVLDLAIAPKDFSMDIGVSLVWDATQMQHWAIFVWEHLGQLDWVLEPGVGKNGVVGHCTRSWRLADTKLASFRNTNWGTLV